MFPEDPRGDTSHDPNDSEDSAETYEDENEDDAELRREMEDQFPPPGEGERQVVPPQLAGLLNDRRQVLTSSQRTERLSLLIRQQRSSEHNLLIHPRPIVS